MSVLPSSTPAGKATSARAVIAALPAVRGVRVQVDALVEAERPAGRARLDRRRAAPTHAGPSTPTARVAALAAVQGIRLGVGAGLSAQAPAARAPTGIERDAAAADAGSEPVAARVAALAAVQGVGRGVGAHLAAERSARRTAAGVHDAPAHEALPGRTTGVVALAAVGRVVRKVDAGVPTAGAPRGANDIERRFGYVAPVVRRGWAIGLVVERRSIGRVADRCLRPEIARNVDGCIERGDVACIGEIVSEVAQRSPIGATWGVDAHVVQDVGRGHRAAREDGAEQAQEARVPTAPKPRREGGGPGGHGSSFIFATTEEYDGGRDLDERSSRL